MSRKTALVLLVLIAGVAGWLWWRPSSAHYLNLPPSAHGPWIALGDSLTEGYGASPGKDYPTLLGQRLGIQIQNFGTSGATTEDGLRRAEEVAAKKPRVVLLLLGGNDSLQQMPHDQIFDNLRRIITRLQKAGTFVVLIGIRSASLRDHYQKSFEELAKEKQTLLVPNILSDILTDPHLMSDAVHPNDQGYTAMAERIESAIHPFLPRLTGP
jgi:lysophospholipase L1-like esterase